MANLNPDKPEDIRFHLHLLKHSNLPKFLLILSRFWTADLSAFMVNKRLKDSKVSFDERRHRNIVDRWQLCDDSQAIYLRAGRAGVGQTTCTHALGSLTISRPSKNADFATL